MNRNATMDSHQDTYLHNLASAGRCTGDLQQCLPNNENATPPT
jgi:hypothetical protein